MSQVEVHTGFVLFTKPDTSISVSDDEALKFGTGGKAMN
jgi:hypothetical protein